DEKQTLRGGLTLKYLGGLASGYGRMTNFNATVDSTSGSGKTIYYIQHGTGQMDFAAGGLDPNNLKLQFTGSGIGADLGASYEYHPDGMPDAHNSRHYKFKVSIAILDIGAVHYNVTDTLRGVAGKYTLNTSLNANDTMNLDRFSNIS